MTNKQLLELIHDWANTNMFRTDWDKHDPSEDWGDLYDRLDEHLKKLED